MSASYSFLTATWISLFGACTAYAIDTPVDQSPPPSASKHTEATQPPSLKTSKQPFLGINAAPVPSILAEHLNLSNQQGAIVQQIQPNSPAAQTPLLPNDIITAISGQAISSPKDIPAILSKLKPGDTITLEYLHKGKALATQTTLANAPAAIAALDSPLQHPLDRLNLDSLDPSMADRVRGLIEKNLGEQSLTYPLDSNHFHPRMGNLLRQLQEQLHNGFGNSLQEKLDHLGQNINFNQSSTIRMMDKLGSIEIQSQNQHKQLTARDPQNQVTWSGPWNSEQDKAAAPPDIQERANNFNFDIPFER